MTKSDQTEWIRKYLINSQEKTSLRETKWLKFVTALALYENSCLIWKRNQTASAKIWSGKTKMSKIVTTLEGQKNFMNRWLAGGNASFKPPCRSCAESCVRNKKYFYFGEEKYSVEQVWRVKKMVMRSHVCVCEFGNASVWAPPPNMLGKPPPALGAAWPKSWAPKRLRAVPLLSGMQSLRERGSQLRAIVYLCGEKYKKNHMSRIWKSFPL